MTSAGRARIRICKRAVEIDPDYGKAWALIAIAQANLCHSFGGKMETAWRKQSEHFALDPKIAEAHCCLRGISSRMAGWKRRTRRSKSRSISIPIPGR